MASGDGIASVYAEKHGRAHNPAYIFAWLVTFFYIFDTVISLTLPSGALIGVPYLYRQFWEEFQNPIVLLAVYLASLCEIFVASKGIHFLKSKLNSKRVPYIESR